MQVLGIAGSMRSMQGWAVPGKEPLHGYMFRMTRLVVLAESAFELAIAASRPSPAPFARVVLAASSLSVSTLTPSSPAPSSFPPELASSERGPPAARSGASPASSCCCCPAPSSAAWRWRAACSPALILWLVDANSRKTTARNLTGEARKSGGSRRRRWV